MLYQVLIFQFLDSTLAEATSKAVKNAVKTIIIGVEVFKTQRNQSYQTFQPCKQPFKRHTLFGITYTAKLAKLASTN